MNYNILINIQACSRCKSSRIDCPTSTWWSITGA